MIFFFIIGFVIKKILNEGGGLGIAYSGIILGGFLAIAGVIQASEGISSSAKRISKMTGLTD